MYDILYIAHLYIVDNQMETGPKVHVYLCIICIRCGMVYVDPGELKWRPYMLTWLSTKFSQSAKVSDATKVCDLFTCR